MDKEKHESYYDGVPPEIEAMTPEEIEIEIEKETQRLEKINDRK